MNPLQILRVIRAHYLAVLIVFVATIAIGITGSMLMPKRYTTTATLVFDVKSPDPVMGQLLPLGQGFVATQSEIIKSDRVALRVVRMLKLDEQPALKKQWQDATGGKGKTDVWVAELLQRGLQVTPATGGSTIINVSYSAGDPTFAAVVANAFAQVYIDTNIELRVDPARQASRWFGDQGKLARENLEAAQTRLSEFQQQKGIVARDEQLDTEMTKLRDLSTQLTILQNQTGEAVSKQQGGANLPEVMQSSVVQSLRSEIARQEAKLQEAAANLGKNHPQYQRMESEVNALKQQLTAETKTVTSSFAASSSASRSREAALQNAINEQKKKILQLRSERDQLAVLQRDVDAAQASYDSVTRRYNQTNLESQLTQTNVSVLNPAVEPPEPSSPNFKKNIAITIAMGFFLGFGVAFLLEFLDRRVRSAEDLEQMLQFPVLAVIEPPQKPKLTMLVRRLPKLALK